MQDLTTGSVSRHLLKTTSFMLVTMVFQTLYFLVDLYWVGRLGKEAVAAVGIAGNLMFITLALTQMLGVGTTTLVSHAAGRRDVLARALLPAEGRVSQVHARGLEAAGRAVGGDPQDRAACRRRVRADGRLPVHRVRGEPAVRDRRAGGLRHRAAHRPGRLHAGRRAGVRRGSGGGTELWRAAGTARARHVQVRAPAVDRRDALVRAAVSRGAGGHGPPVLQRPAGAFGRRRVPANRVVELHGLGNRVRRLEYVPGDGQQRALAGELVRSHRRRRGARISDVAVAGLRAALDLVPVGRVGDAADGA